MEKSKAILEKASSLGEAIRQLRELRGLTLRELATSVGVSAPFLSDLEHNRRRTDKLDVFARAPRRCRLTRLEETRSEASSGTTRLAFVEPRVSELPEGLQTCRGHSS